MIAYFDTSALIKNYVNEKGSEIATVYWNQAVLIVVSEVAFAEWFSALSRKYRENTISSEQYLKTSQTFERDWRTLITIEVTNHLNKIIKELSIKYALRGFDMIHLATALYFQQFETDEFFFLCADHRLNEAARNEQLQVIDVS